MRVCGSQSKRNVYFIDSYRVLSLLSFLLFDFILMSKKTLSMESLSWKTVSLATVWIFHHLFNFCALLVVRNQAWVVDTTLDFHSTARKTIFKQQKTITLCIFTAEFEGNFWGNSKDSFNYR